MVVGFGLLLLLLLLPLELLLLIFVTTLVASWLMIIFGVEKELG